jgi:hypothetical protein
MKFEEKPLLFQLAMSIIILTLGMFIAFFIAFLCLGVMNYLIFKQEAKYAFGAFFDLFNRFLLWVFLSFVGGIISTIGVFIGAEIHKRKLKQQQKH